MERAPSQPTSMDGDISELGDPRIQAKLERLKRAIPWEKLAEPIRAIYANDGEAGGRPNIPVVMMLRVVMLQNWFNLSDPAMEGMLLDRISFRRFVGLNLIEEAVDQTTIVKFRKRLLDQGLTSRLLDDVVASLKEAGMIVEEGTLVDATIIEAQRGQKTDDGLGYKAHVATDSHGMIKDYRYGTAGEHDSRHMDELIEGETQEVFADSAYMDKARKERLEAEGIFCGIIERRVRGQGELTKAQKRTTGCAPRSGRMWSIRSRE